LFELALSAAKDPFVPTRVIIPNTIELKGILSANDLAVVPSRMCGRTKAGHPDHFSMQDLQKRIWRTVTGILLGFILSAFIAALFPWNLGMVFPFPDLAAKFVSAPVLAIPVLLDWIVPARFEGIIYIILISLFYPALLGIYFYFGGEKQTWSTVMIEVLIVLGLLGLGFVGWGVMSIGID